MPKAIEKVKTDEQAEKAVKNPAEDAMTAFERWKARISLAKEARKSRLESGERSRDHYEGKIFPQGYHDTVAVNLVYVDMKQSVSEYYSKNPKIFVEPDEPGAEADARAAELIVNKKWGDLKMKKVCRAAIKSAKFDGVCAFKTYFNFKKDFIKDEWDDRVQNDEVRTDRVPLKYLLKDSTSPCWEASPWIVQECRAKREDIADRFEVKKDQITVTAAEPGTEKYAADVKEDFEYGTFYEIEDRRKGTVSYIVDGIAGFVQGPDKKRYPYDTMYDFLTYNDIPERSDPLGDYEFWRDQLMELATYRTMEVAHAKKGNSKYIVTAQTKLTEEQIAQIKSSDDAVIVTLKPDQAVVALQHAQLDASIYQAENACRQDIQIISKQALRQMPGTDKTATEVKAVEMAASQQVSENMERLEECMASIANKWIALMQKNYTSTRMISLSAMSSSAFLSEQNTMGDMLQGNEKHPFVKMTKKNISKKLKASIKAGSTMADNDQSRMARFQGFAGFVATAQLMAGVDHEELLTEAAEVFGVENDNLLLRKDNPMEESRLLNNGVYIAPKISEDHPYHLEVHRRESNNSTENVIHILGHELFEAQKKAMEQAKAVTAPPAPQGMPQPGGMPPGNGASFNGMMPLPPMPGGEGPVGQPQAGPLPPGGPAMAPPVQ